MISEKTKILIVNYLNRQATILERNELEKWLDNPTNLKTFMSFVKINYLIELNMDMFNPNDSKRDLLEFIQKEKKKRKLRNMPLLKYAAVAILLLGIGYFFQQRFFKNDSELIYTEDSIILQLGNDNTEVLNEDGAKTILDKEGNILGSQIGSKIIYNSNLLKNEIVYNTLVVPYGKRFELQLSDGTNVHLNAGSSLKYPVHFVPGEVREVFSKGQVYFDVAKDENHPFVVNTEKVGIIVLGTEFSISSYPEDTDISTVLVEGSVSIFNNEEQYNSDTATLLKPGYKADWNRNEGNIKIEKADVNLLTAWVNGKLVFKHIPFKDVIKKLERHYNVQIVNNNYELGEDLITASFDVETIEEVFKVINEVHPISYKIVSNKVVID